MPSGAYHTSFNEESKLGQPIRDPNRRYISNIPLLPIRRVSKFKGPAPEMPPDQTDIIDEALHFFKANIMFRTFDMRGYADRLFVYITLYINACLVKCAHKSKGEADRILYSFAIENFSIPGDATFALGGLCPKPTNRGDEDQIRAYLQQIRQETYVRFLDLLYAHGDAEPDKWWICFSKRRYKS